MTCSVLIAIKLKKYTILAANTQQNSGSTITNRIENKFFYLNENIVCCYSGSASDAQYTIDCIRSKVFEYFVKTKQKINTRIVAQILRVLCHKKKSECNFICAGWDFFHGNQVYFISQCGAIFSQKILTSESFIYNNFCFLEQREEVEYLLSRELIIKMISIVISSAKNTGSVIEICNISSRGIQKEIFVPFLKSNKFYFFKKLLFF